MPGPSVKQQSLSLTAIASFDHYNPPDVRNTVVNYLSEQRTIVYPAQRPQHGSSASSFREKLNDNLERTASSPPAPHRINTTGVVYTRKSEHVSSGSEDRRGGEKRAMIIGGIDSRTKTEGIDAEERKRKKKGIVRPSLVGSMKPRQPTSNDKSTKVTKEAPEGRPRESSSSPMLTSRLQATTQMKLKEAEARKESKENRAPPVASFRSKRQSQSVSEDDEERVIVTTKLRGKQTKTIQDDRKSNDQDEHAEREFALHLPTARLG